MFLFLGLKIIFCYSAEHAAWIEVAKTCFFLVNLYPFCFIKTNFRNNFKYLSGHPLSLDTFELKLTIKKPFFMKT